MERLESNGLLCIYPVKEPTPSYLQGGPAEGLQAGVEWDELCILVGTAEQSVKNGLSLVIPKP